MQPSKPALFATDRLSGHRLAPGEESLLQEVFEAAGDYFLSITGRPQPDPDAAARELHSSAATPGREIVLLVRQDDGTPVGALGWWVGQPEPEIALVGMLLIVPEERKQGLAREALEGLSEWLREQGVTRMRTGVGAGDQRTHTVLQALGFAPLDQRTHVSLDRGRIMIAFFEREI